MTEWKREDVVWLRNLLGQPSGKTLIDTLRSRIPKIKSLTKEGSWVEAVKKQGYEEMLDVFLSLSEFSPIELREIQSIDLTREPD
jgi:hypothetical protein